MASSPIKQRLKSQTVGLLLEASITWVLIWSWICTCHLFHSNPTDTSDSREKKQNVLVCFPCWRSRDNSQWPLPLLFECLQVRHQCTLTSVCTGKEDSQKTLTSMWLQYPENLSGCFAYNVTLEKLARNGNSLCELLRRGSAVSHVQTGQATIAASKAGCWHSGQVVLRAQLQWEHKAWEMKKMKENWEI